jgi:hypothetical protein
LVLRDDPRGCLSGRPEASSAVACGLRGQRNYLSLSSSPGWHLSRLFSS